MSDTNDKKNVIKFNVNKTYVKDSFAEAFERGDWCGAISVLNNWRDNFGIDEEYFENLIDVYDEMGEYGCTLNAWYEYIFNFGLQNGALEKYEGLAVTYANLGMENESMYYYKKMISSIQLSKIPLDFDEDEIDFISEHSSNLKMAYSKNNPEPSDALKEGLNYARADRLDDAMAALSKIDEESSEYVGAVNLIAICHMLKGEFAEGLKICDQVLEKHPDDVQTMTNIAAIYTEQGKKEESAKIVKALAERSDVSTDNLYRIASVACENGMDEEGLKIFLKLEKESPFDKNDLYFVAVGAYRTGRYAMSSKYFRKILTIYPKSKVAAYYFAAAEEGEDAQKFGAAYEPIDMPYIYHLPKEERENRTRFFLKEERASRFDARAYNKQKSEYLEWAFDEYNGEDLELQILAVKVAARSFYDEFLYDVLMRYNVADVIKITALYLILLRNRHCVINLVIANIYCRFEFFPLNLGRKQRKQFICCTADLISRYSYYDEENVKKLSEAAELLNRAMTAGENPIEADDKSLKCAIYLASGLSEQSWMQTVKTFEADFRTVLKIFRISDPSALDRMAQEAGEDLSPEGGKEDK